MRARGLDLAPPPSLVPLFLLASSLRGGRCPLLPSNVAPASASPSKMALISSAAGAFPVSVCWLACGREDGGAEEWEEIGGVEEEGGEQREQIEQ